ncbi:MULTISPECIES: N-acetyl-gamma-glutamyl-phosphate reductase [Actinosynnema]|uniref:N-acetyl-gamma-glutamyl-phosphate reductase n=1 Tax=Actinosynnema TaxID=40566 RepID=UPI0020A61116|nr:N-acetyl-gamma-glutamyl-phosphate reductase [Actinosynnema pretiosum]MCP2092326.1 N-acetyl-gamma-glutamyl-phosphate reductase [Actinosynnema pretiosum]
MSGRVRVGVVGASGLAGGELIRLVDAHPDLELAFLGGSGSAGARPAQLHPGLRKDFGLVVEPVVDSVADRVDVLLLSTPAPVSAVLAERFADRVPAVVDLSGAFRVRDEETHRRWYPKVPRSAELADRFVHGVPELVGDRFADAPLISLAGCYATAITLGIAPLLLELGLSVEHVLVDGKSGSSGGGIHLRTADLHPFRAGAIAPYSPGGHRHAAEVADFFGGKAGAGRVGRISMSAYGVANVRGLLASCYALTDEVPDERTLLRAYTRFYRGRRFVRVRRPGETLIPVPDPQATLGSNYCDVSVVPDEEGGRIVVLAALDNLVKGAAGQALQAVNLRFGLPEDAGLGMEPVMPV